MLKRKIFIASSRENVELARAVQENLEPEFETTVWDQDTFHLSQYPVDELLRALRMSDFGVFILAPDDRVEIRGEEYSAVRDNVIYELGLFTGGLGRERTFILVPKVSKPIRLPSDLEGLTVALYDPSRVDRNLLAALAPSCSKIRRLIRDSNAIEAEQTIYATKFGLFMDFVGDFEALFLNAQVVTLFFIHSRRWRENNLDHMSKFLAKPQARMIVYLPDTNNRVLMAALAKHFTDGDFLRSYIADAYEFFAQQAKAHLGKVKVNLFPTYPTYTFYRFDDVAVVALYPTTPVRRDVPTFQIEMGSKIGAFLQYDLDELERTSVNISPDELLERKKRIARK